MMKLDIKIRATYLFRALQCYDVVHLGEIVTINGKEYSIINGVKRRGKNILWDCIKIDKYDTERIDMQIEAIQSMMTRKPLAWIGAVLDRYDFFMTNWYAIDSRNGHTYASRGI